jgi:hypothetical protein
MTLPDERYRAVQWAERFLKELATDRKKYPRIPTAVRREAYSILRHYPSDWDMKRAADDCPEVFQQRMEPLTRLVMQYEQEQKDA